MALRQAEAVRGRLEAAYPDLAFELVAVRTTGDVRLDTPMHMLGANHLYTRQQETPMLEGRVDLCTHSMKDLPSELPDSCVIGAMLSRADVRDALVCGPRLRGVRSLSDLPEGAVIGTGSLRRQAQIRAQFPQVTLRGIRGNVDTRLAKAKGDLYDGCILALVGLDRLGLASEAAAAIPVDVLVPAAGQGAIGVEVRRDDEEMLRLVSALDDPLTHECVDAERAVLAALGGSCKVPVGIYARHEGLRVRMDAIVLSQDGSRVARSSQEMPAPARAGELVRATVEDLMSQGAMAILEDILRGQELPGQEWDVRGGEGA